MTQTAQCRSQGGVTKGTKGDQLFQFAPDFPCFCPESPVSQETPPSRANWGQLVLSVSIFLSLLRPLPQLLTPLSPPQSPSHLQVGAGFPATCVQAACPQVTEREMLQVTDGAADWQVQCPCVLDSLMKALDKGKGCRKPWLGPPPPARSLTAASPDVPIPQRSPLPGLYFQRPPQSKVGLPPQPSFAHSEQGPQQAPDKHMLRQQATNDDISISTLQKGKPRPNTS